MDIGQKIKMLRMSKNLTLEELADRCELTKGFLSQLERNLTSPSISTLDDILEALGTNLSDFFKEETEERYIFTEADFYVKKLKNAKIHWIVPDAQKRMMEPILLELDVQGKSRLIEPHDGEEFGYVLSGEITLILSQQRFAAKAGETFYVSGEKPHRIVNAGDAPAKVLWVMTPPDF